MDKFTEFLKEFKWTTICGGAGLFLAILIITINFWRTLLLLALVAAGVIIGLALDKKSGWAASFFNRKDS